MEKYMEEALKEAAKAGEAGDVPIGCVIVKGDKIVGRGHNRVEADRDPCAHAEILAIREAARTTGRERLEGCRMYVTLEPCSMCAGAIVLARIEELIFGAKDPKTGACGSLYNIVEDERLNHRVAVRQGMMEQSCSQMIRGFFSALRAERIRTRKEDRPERRS